MLFTGQQKLSVPSRTHSSLKQRMKNVYVVVGRFSFFLVCLPCFSGISKACACTECPKCPAMAAHLPEQLSPCSLLSSKETFETYHAGTLPQLQCNSRVCIVRILVGAGKVQHPRTYEEEAQRSFIWFCSSPLMVMLKVRCSFLLPDGMQSLGPLPFAVCLHVC